MSWRLVAAACLALAIAFAVRWILPGERAQVALPTLPDTRFDYTLSDFSARFTNSEGKVELLISGPRLEHDSGTRIATLTEPRFHFEPDGADWRGQANEGRFDRDDDLLILEGEVVLTQPQEFGELVLTTHRLQHHRLARTISADQTVDVKRPGTWLRSGGLMMTLDHDTIELFNHVQAQVEVAGSGDNNSRSAVQRQRPGQ